MKLMSRAPISIQEIWTQGKGKVWRWTPQQKSLMMSLIIFACIGSSLGLWVLIPALAPATVRSSEQFSVADDLTTYGYSDAHENFNAAETLITASTAHTLKQKWVHGAKNSVSDQPAVTTVNGRTIVFWGSWDGFLHATDANTNAKVWSTLLGKTTDE